MQITHPQGSYQELPAENVFLALDEMGTQLGVGYVVYQYLPHFSPDVPVNIYFEINSQPGAWYLLFGALTARARQLREMNPGVAARFYTCIPADDQESVARYERNDMNCRQFSSHVRIFRPEGMGNIPMACSVAHTPLNTREEQMALLERLGQNDLHSFDLPYLQRMMGTPHFCALTLLHGNVRVGEAIFYGEGSRAELAAIYVTPAYRRQGMAKILLHRGMALLADEGVQDFTAAFSSQSTPQVHLARDFHAEDLQQVQYLYPERQL